MSWGLAAGALGALVASMLAYTRFHVHHAQARHPPRGELVTVDGTETHVLRRGDPDATTIVLLHGLNGVLEDFTGALVDRLAEDYDVVALDRPGYGYTDRPDARRSRMDHQAAWLDAVLDRLSVDEALVLGHSLGAALAARYAIEHPDRVRGLALVAPYLYPTQRPPGALPGIPDWPLVRHVVAHLLLVPVGRPLAKRLAAQSFNPEPMPPGYVHLWADLSLRPGQFLTVLDEARHLDQAVAEAAPRYAKIGAPTVIVAGQADALVDPEAHARRFHETVPDAWLSLVEGAGHMLPWTQPVQVLRAVEELDHLADEHHGANGHRLAGTHA